MSGAKALVSDRVAELVKPADLPRYARRAGLDPKLIPQPGLETSLAIQCSSLFKMAEDHRAVAPLLESICDDYKMRAAELLEQAREEYPDDAALQALQERFAQLPASTAETALPLAQVRQRTRLPRISLSRRSTIILAAATVVVGVVGAVVSDDYKRQGSIWRAVRSSQCDSGDPGEVACWEIAKVLYKEARAAAPKALAKEENLKKIRTYLDKACNEGNGNAEACGAFGSALSHGEFGLNIDWQRAVKIAQHVCEQTERQNHLACHVYAEGLDKNLLGGQREPELRILSLLTGSCSEEAPRACVDAATKYRSQPHGATSEYTLCPTHQDCRKRSYGLLEKACGWEHPAGCTQLAVMLSEDGDEERAKLIYVKACNLKDAEACLQKAYFTPDKKFENYKQSCELGSGLGCFNAGVFSSNDIEAYQFFERGCALNNGEACGNAGLFLEKGRGTAQGPNPGAAFDRYAKGWR